MASDPGISFREANRSDVPVIVGLLADDELGAQRERIEAPLPRPYYDAFDAIDSDPNQQLLLACRGDTILGALQLTFMPSLTYVGRWRSQIESVRVAASGRSLGTGRMLNEEAIRRSRERGCRMVQLTTDKRRTRAHTFYERLGFVASHEGMKLHLSDD
jgi:ribosomal protein S18 acetylase RimI-like enzyme